MLNNDIIEWIKVLDTPQANIGNHKICPFANSAKYRLEEINLADITPSIEDIDLIIYKVEDSISMDELSQRCNVLNKLQDILVYLPDHKDRNTYINGVQTNNGKHNLILCQKREKLIKARVSLMKTDYYSYWAKEYLEEIMSA